ncbi:MAG: protein kinase [Desulfurococcales archaeon]|nr:protein kinase [Desulfurococcales archaeon]
MKIDEEIKSLLNALKNDYNYSTYETRSLKSKTYFILSETARRCYRDFKQRLEALISEHKRLDLEIKKARDRENHYISMIAGIVALVLAVDAAEEVTHNIKASITLVFSSLFFTGIGVALLNSILNDKKAGKPIRDDIRGWLFGFVITAGIMYAIGEYVVGIEGGTAVIYFMEMLAGFIIVLAIYRLEMRGVEEVIVPNEAKIKEVAREIGIVEAKLNGINDAVQILGDYSGEAPSPEVLVKAVDALKQSCNGAGELKDVEEYILMIENHESRLKVLKPIIKFLEIARDLSYIESRIGDMSSEELIDQLKYADKLVNEMRELMKDEGMTSALKDLGDEAVKIINYFEPINDEALTTKTISIGIKLATSMDSGVSHEDLNTLSREIKELLFDIASKHGANNYLYRIAKKLSIPLKSLTDYNIMAVQDKDKTPFIPVMNGFNQFVHVIDEALASSLYGVIEGYGCIPNISVDLSWLDFHPKSLSGRWNCCRLGCGGQGCAYLCRRDDAQVVFKVPKPIVGIFDFGGEAAGGFRDFSMTEEIVHARRLMRLEHPSILKPIGYSSDLPVFAYEYALYGSLAWQINKGWKPSIRDILLIGIQIGDALRYIHSRGLVHGDVKASNVLISSGKRALLGDLFTPMILLGDTTQALTRATRGWRAPEQVLRDLLEDSVRRGLESRIDVYQLGNLLLYLSIGKTIDGEEAEDEIVKSVLSKAHRHLTYILLRALSLHPAQRPSSEELVMDIALKYKVLHNII